MHRFPAVFVSHGAPSVALEDDDYTHALRRFGAGVGSPEAILVASAHWEARAPLRINAQPRPPLIYDFGGFPEPLYRLTYPAPGAPELAEETAALLTRAGIPNALERDRGWDHGVWVPLRIAFPGADVPVVEISLPVPRTPADLIAIGRALAPLRDRVLILGSGGVVHNLSLLHWGTKDAPVDGWARGFDDWVGVRLEAGDLDTLAGYRAAAPDAARAVPTAEHFDPLLLIVASAGEDERASPIYDGFHYGNLSMRCFTIG